MSNRDRRLLMVRMAHVHQLHVTVTTMLKSNKMAGAKTPSYAKRSLNPQELMLELVRKVCTSLEYE